MDNKEVGRRIRKTREDLGLTQSDVGDFLGLTRAAIGKMEKGNSITLKNLFELPRVLHRPIEYFLGLDSELSPKEAEWLEVFRSMPEMEQRYWLGTLRAWVSGKNEE